MIHVQQMEFSGKVWSREKEGGVYNKTETFGQSTFLFKNDFSLGEYVMNKVFIGIINRTNNCTCLDSFVNTEIKICKYKKLKQTQDNNFNLMRYPIPFFPHPAQKRKNDVTGLD